MANPDSKSEVNTHYLHNRSFMLDDSEYLLTSTSSTIVFLAKMVVLVLRFSSLAFEPEVEE